MAKLTRKRAEELLRKHTTEEHLFTHAAAVSAAMGAMAEHFGEDKDHWEGVGYLHDVDYEKYPDEHCHHVQELLAGEDVDNADIAAIISHGWGITVDELTGIIQAYARMRPERLDGMEVKSLKKKFKDKRFAAKCNRALIKQGCAMLGMELGDVMSCCIRGMQAHAEELGL